LQGRAAASRSRCRKGAAQNGDDLQRDPLEVRKTTRARRSYFREAFIFR
jgi:hypothetical protein